MRDNIIRLGILGTLIILCIWQTGKLWLGDTSSHNFLNAAIVDAVTQPKEMWFNNNGLAYKIEGENNDLRLGLIEELEGEMKKKNLKLEKSPYTYEQLLSKRGIFYEYGLSLSLEEAIGVFIKGMEVNKITQLFIDVDEGFNNQTYIYLIGEQLEDIRMVKLNRILNLHTRIIETLSDEEKVEGLKVYQASRLSSNISDSSVFVRNVFYPTNNQRLPIIYKPLEIKKVVQGEDEEEQRLHLESYINSLFNNSLYKDYNKIDDNIIYSDNISLNVTYTENGVLEFRRTLSTEGTKLTAVEKMNRINSFIAKSEAIPDSLKVGLYLNEMIEDEESGDTIYRFAYRYNGFEVLLTDEVKKQLGVDAFLELVIKGGQIIRGKWLMLEFEASQNAAERRLTREGYIALSDTVELCNINNLAENPLSYLECAYIVTALDQRIKLDWASLYQGNWYYP